jgi:hypothetical protein
MASLELAMIFSGTAAVYFKGHFQQNFLFSFFFEKSSLGIGQQ